MHFTKGFGPSNFEILSKVMCCGNNDVQYFGFTTPFFKKVGMLGEVKQKHNMMIHNIMIPIFKLK